MEKNEFINNILPFVTKASRYLGNEVNAVKKDLSKVDLKFALAFPDVYEVGMSHLGLQILYSILNSKDSIACERVFAPWQDLEIKLLENRIPLATLESFVPVKNFDIIGFSLEYELGYSNILKMLKLAGIPLLSKQRDEKQPFIIAGGPCTFNPEPLAPFFDACVIGEGEEVVVELCEVFLKWKRRRAKKAKLLEELSSLQGIYIPSFFKPEYRDDGTVKQVIPVKNDYQKISKRFVSNFNNAPYCTSSVVPFMQIIHDRISLEIARGCSHGCRFCMAGMIYRPVRERSCQKIRELAAKTLADTGYEELSLASLSTGDFPRLHLLLKQLMMDHHQDRIAIALPSVRAGTLTRKIMEEIKQVRKTGFTIAPEAGTQRLRNVINKGITEDEIIATAEQIFAAGWNLIKLYFMIGLPTETQEDLAGIIDLSKKIARLSPRGNHKNQINISIATFVPKPHTPFQWESQLAPEIILKKQNFLKNHLTGKRIRLKWHNHFLSALEGIFARGDRRLSNVLFKAHALGAGFEGWSEHFKPELWERAFQLCNIDKNFYLRKKSFDECLPWQHICCGVRNDFLKKEYAKALRAEISPDCRDNCCQGCGLCNRQKLAELPAAEIKEELKDDYCSSDSLQRPSGPVFRYRCRFSKFGPARFISHLELSSCLARTLRRAKLPLKYSQGYHPHPRIIFQEALPVGMASQEEFFDIEVTREMTVHNLPDLLNRYLPAGLKILSAEEITLKKLPLLAKLATKKFLISFCTPTSQQMPKPEDIRCCIDAFFAAKEFFVSSLKKNKFIQINIRPMIQKLALQQDGTLAMELQPSGPKMPKIEEIIGAIFHLPEKEKTALQIVKLSTESTRPHLKYL